MSIEQKTKFPKLVEVVTTIHPFTAEEWAQVLPTDIVSAELVRQLLNPLLDLETFPTPRAPIEAIAEQTRAAMARIGSPYKDVVVVRESDLDYHEVFGSDHPSGYILFRYYTSQKNAATRSMFAAVGLSFFEPMKEVFEKRFAQVRRFGSHSDYLKPLAWRALEESFTFEAAFLASGLVEQAEAIHHFSQMCLGGNYPAGFDKNWKLVVVTD